MIQNIETNRISLSTYRINTEHDTDRCYTPRCYIRVKEALSSAFEQISDSWSHIGISDKTLNKEELFNSNFRSSRDQPRHLKQKQTRGAGYMKDVF